MTNILATKVPLLLTLIVAEIFIVYIGKGLGNLEINQTKLGMILICVNKNPSLVRGPY